ncbi:unnamed protein product [Blepharisma stoltei]|uniref:Uncharacterized protein n=1 Tax=Blepharisma stoltei TaxID=1481888 RepID=A0AAU9JU96_9CILI|nr:unnamed protein product [Blepharisma stoltei]
MNSNFVKLTNVLQPKERVILQKYITAEAIRQVKESNHSAILSYKLEPIIQIHENTRRINDLEHRAIEAWRETDYKKLRRTYKIANENIQDYNLIQRKILKDLQIQDSKFIRKRRPPGPKLDPLPYLKKARERLSNSIEELGCSSDSYEAQETYSPVLTYIPKHGKKPIKFTVVRDLTPTLHSKASRSFVPEFRSQPKGHKNSTMKYQKNENW